MKVMLFAASLALAVNSGAAERVQRYRLTNGRATVANPGESGAASDAPVVPVVKGSKGSGAGTAKGSSGPRSSPYATKIVPMSAGGGSGGPLGLGRKGKAPNYAPGMNAGGAQADNEISAGALPARGGIGSGDAPKSASGGGGSSRAQSDGGGGGAAAPPPPKSPETPAPVDMSGQVLTVQCFPTHNVLTWKLLNHRNSNSVLRSVNGMSNTWICGGPDSIAPCTDLSVHTFVDNDVVPGKTYEYKQKSAPACASNTVKCPGGGSSDTSCLVGGIDPAGGGTGGGTVDVECTGGNPLCICVKTVGAYNRYTGTASAAVRAAFPGLDAKPDGMSDGVATAKICEAYNANKTLGANSACRSQGDEIVFEDPHSPSSQYPTISVDVIISGGAFWAKSIAACARGVQ